MGNGANVKWSLQIFFLAANEKKMFKKAKF